MKKTRPLHTLLPVLLLIALCMQGCARQSSGGLPPPPEGEAVFLRHTAPHSFFAEVRNDSGKEIQLKPLLVALLQSRGYDIEKDRSKAGYIITLHVNEILAVNLPEDEIPIVEDYNPVYGATLPAILLGAGIGAGVGGRSGLAIGLGAGLLFGLGADLASRPGYEGYAMSAELELGELTGTAHERHKTRLVALAAVPAGIDPLPALEDRMANKICDILP